jgi:hypothetical protein
MLLEIHQARFDWTPEYPSLLFTTLENLLICIAGFQGVVRGDKIDPAREAPNIVALLRSLTHSLTALQISGDLLYPEFLSLTWPRLHKFAITEHTPTSYIPVPDLVSRMPALRELLILYSADLSRDWDIEIYPPFILGTAGSKLLISRSPLLMSVTLSNMQPTDPIFTQLLRALSSLHLVAMVDGYLPIMGRPPRLWPAPLTHNTALIALERISHLTDLTKLSLTLDDLVTATLIHCVMAVFPRLRFLEFGHAGYLYSAQLCPDVRDVTPGAKADGPGFQVPLRHVPRRWEGR